jgi:hypothetical protein
MIFESPENYLKIAIYQDKKAPWDKNPVSAEIAKKVQSNAFNYR